MKITMKNMIAFAAAVVLTLAFGSAYAANDGLADQNMIIRETGTELFASFLKDQADIGKGAAAGGVRAEGVSRSEEIANDDMPVLFRGHKDTGTELYEAFLKHDADVAKGSASGGVRSRVANWPDDVYPYGIAK